MSQRFSKYVTPGTLPGPMGWALPFAVMLALSGCSETENGGSSAANVSELNNSSWSVSCQNGSCKGELTINEADPSYADLSQAEVDAECKRLNAERTPKPEACSQEGASSSEPFAGELTCSFKSGNSIIATSTITVEPTAQESGAWEKICEDQGVSCKVNTDACSGKITGEITDLEGQLDSAIAGQICYAMVSPVIANTTFEVTLYKGKGSEHKAVKVCEGTFGKSEE